MFGQLSFTGMLSPIEQAPMHCEQEEAGANGAAHFKNINNRSNTGIYFYLQTSDGLSST